MARAIHLAGDGIKTLGRVNSLDEFIESENIDAVFISGNITQPELVIQSIQESMKNIPKPNEEIVKLAQKENRTPEEDAKLKPFGEQQRKAFNEGIARGYAPHEQFFSQFKQKHGGLEIGLTTGEKDFTAMYELMPSVKMLDLEPMKFKGINVVGLLNPGKPPEEYQQPQIAQMLQEFYPNYRLSQAPGENKQLQELHKQHLEQLKKAGKADLILSHNNPISKNPQTSSEIYFAQSKLSPGYALHGDIDPNTFYVIDINEKTKKVNWAHEYKFVKKASEEQNVVPIKPQEEELKKAA